MQNYASLQENTDPDEEGGVVYHVAEPSRARWNHIEDLDSFFSRMYRYHQKHGFLCMLLQEIFELNQFVFVVFLTTYLIYGIDYAVLFRDVPLTTPGKVTLHDVVLPLSECVDNFTLITWVVLCIAQLVWFLKLIRGVYHMVQFWDIKQFYNTALKIDDNHLDNLTWHEVQTRVRTVQLEQQMCIHKRELTDLDIYHRILRQQNYLVAMVNKKLLPPRFNLPLIGECVYWTKGFRYNIQLLLFWSPWSPFENPWHLREEYRKTNIRHDLAARLSRHVFWLSVANILFSPLVLLWQILYAFFNYAEMIRREPGSLGIRHWSMYGRLYLRHFNELDHELQARLSRAHRPASEYLAAFVSPLGTVIARYIAFMSGAIFAILVGLSLYDEDVLTVEHVLTLMTALGGLVAICRSLIPDETTSWCPEVLLTHVLENTHYLPAEWKGQAHTSRVRTEFQQLFQYRFIGLIEELLSPILTPILLYKYVYPRVLDIVDFYRNFTVSVVGVGDVCSFAQMDVKRHGNPEWHDTSVLESPFDTDSPPDQYTQAEDGKIELSLMHFKHTNPSWEPPIFAQQFVEQVNNESSVLGYSEHQQPTSGGDFMLHENLGGSSMVQQQQLFNSRFIDYNSPMSGMYRNEGPNVARDMTFSTLYLHDRHHRLYGSTRPTTRRPAEETTPLLSTVSH